MDRRRFIELGAYAAAALPFGCGDTPPSGPDPATGGRLDVTWKPASTSLAAGEHALGLGTGRDGFIRIPSGHVPSTPAALALLLHGAGQDAREWEDGFPLFDELGLVVLSVDSRAASWDVRYGAFGPDVAFIEEALAKTFEGCNVDPSRMAIAGFSDGASYALSLGLTNGDLFTHVLGFSPGFVRTDERRGAPPVFLSHGTNDTVLPVAFTRALAEQLEADGHDVLFEEFDGGHALPIEIGRQGFEWFVSDA